MHIGRFGGKYVLRYDQRSKYFHRPKYINTHSRSNMFAVQDELMTSTRVQTQLRHANTYKMDKRPFPEH